MKAWGWRLFFLALIIAGGVWAWRVFFPSPEQVIRHRLAELAQAASYSGKEGDLARVINSEKFASFFSPDVRVTVDVPGRSQQTFNGRDEMMQAAMVARALTGSLQVEFVDVNLDLPPPKVLAVANLTAKAKVAGELQVQELKVTFRKNGRDWLINRVETVKTLM